MENFKIHIFSSEPSGFLVNSFIIETDQGLILVDTQFLVSTALKVKKIIEDLKKPLSAVFVTHPHPDHFNGVSIILGNRSDVPVIATEETVKIIKMVEKDKRDYWTPQYKDEYPKITRFPDKIVASGEAIKVAGIEIVFDELGPVESSNTTMLNLPNEKVLIASDLIYNRIHPWLAEGHSATWLEKIEQVKKRYANYKKIYAGHGLPGGMELFTQQADYIEYFREQVSGIIKDGKVDLQKKGAVINNMKSAFKGYELDFLIDMNIDGVLKEF